MIAASVMTPSSGEARAVPATASSPVFAAGVRNEEEDRRERDGHTSDCREDAARTECGGELTADGEERNAAQSPDDLKIAVDLVRVAGTAGGDGERHGAKRAPADAREAAP